MTKTILALALAMAATAFAAEPAPAPPSDIVPVRFERGPTPVKATLYTDAKSIEPGGAFRLYVRFDLEPGWHIYSKDPGDAGAPTRIKWKLPKGFVPGPVDYPPARKIVEPGNITVNAYEKQVVLSAEVRVPKSARKGAVAVLAADADWLMCKDKCILGAAKLMTEVPVR